MRNLSISSVALFAIAITASVASEQNPQPDTSACVSQTEHIYEPGVDGVRPPQPKLIKNSEGPKLRESASFELLVNSQGSVCRVNVIRAKDQNSAARTAEFMLGHWSFSPGYQKREAGSCQIRYEL